VKTSVVSDVPENTQNCSQTQLILNHLPRWFVVIGLYAFPDSPSLSLMSPDEVRFAESPEFD
jgi:hypothetical protein